MRRGRVFERGGEVCGSFVVLRAAEAGLFITPLFPWVVEGEGRRQRIYTETRRKAEGIATRSADGVGFDKWDYEYSLPGRPTRSF